MSKTIIEIQNVSKKYRIGLDRKYLSLRDEIAKRFSPKRRKIEDQKKEFWALKNISFNIQEGEAVGIIGQNGAGKSTLLKILSQITPPTIGQITMRGRVASLLEVGTGFHPELTGRENIYLNGAILGMTRKEISKKFDQIVAFAEVEKFLDTPVKRYSSGMYVRLAFAVAAHLEPEILVVDEVLAVGDAQFQKRCLGKMGEVASQGRTVMFVSHNMAAVLSLCSKAILLDTGSIRVTGPVRQVVDSYLGESLKLGGEVVFSGARPQPGGELRLVAARILDSIGRPSGYVDLLKGLTLEIEYEVQKPIRSAQVAFELWNSMGVCVLCSTDFDAHPEDRMSIKNPGHYNASCFIPPMYLRTGRYWIDLGSSVPGVRMFDEIHNAVAFEVVDTGSIESKLSQGRRGVISPLLVWKTERTA